MIKDKRYPNLFLLPAAQTKDKNAVSPEQMQKLCAQLKEEFDYIIIDCPAGIEQGFKNAIAGAGSAIVVTVPEVSSVRDADRIIGLLSANDIDDVALLINRYRSGMAKRGDMLTIDDTQEVLGLDLIGVVPDDEDIIRTTNIGEPASADKKSLAGKAYRNIASRLLGEEVPLIDFEQGNSFIGRMKKAFKG